jgi:hypothetical protein
MFMTQTSALKHRVLVLSMFRAATNVDLKYSSPWVSFIFFESEQGDDVLNLRKFGQTTAQFEQTTAPQQMSLTRRARTRGDLSHNGRGEEGPGFFASL